MKAYVGDKVEIDTENGWVYAEVVAVVSGGFVTRRDGKDGIWAEGSPYVRPFPFAKRLAQAERERQEQCERGDALQTENEALRATLAAVRAFCECAGDDLEHRCASQEEWDGYSAARADVLDIIDKGNSDE